MSARSRHLQSGNKIIDRQISLAFRNNFPPDLIGGGFKNKRNCLQDSCDSLGATLFAQIFFCWRVGILSSQPRPMHDMKDEHYYTFTPSC